MIAQYFLNLRTINILNNLLFSVFFYYNFNGKKLYKIVMLPEMMASDVLPFYIYVLNIFNIGLQHCPIPFHRTHLGQRREALIQIILGQCGLRVCFATGVMQYMIEV